MAGTRTVRLTALAACVALAFATGCATVARPHPTLLDSRPADARALAQAAEDFYTATDVEHFRAAVDAAQKAGPDSGVYHELAALLARFEDRSADEQLHRIAAARDLSYDATVSQLYSLESALMNVQQKAAYLGLLETLSEQHPKPDVRAAAAYLLSAQLQIQGDDEGSKAAVARMGPTLPFAVVGGWDNDQGKGFDAEEQPEREVDLSATYDGALMPIGWEKNPPRDYRGEIELGDFLAPAQWSFAYAATGVRVAQAGEYELRLGSTDPLKVWVNGALVFEGRELDRGWQVDQFVIPVTLAQGDNQVLVKTAHRTGGWVLFARLTGKDGAPAAYEAIPAGHVAKAAKQGPVLTSEDLLERRVAHLPERSARRALQLAICSERAHGGDVAVRYAQGLMKAHPDALMSRYALTSALWADNERGRTADLLTDLDKQTGDALPFIRVMQARFWQQEGLRTRARKALLTLAQKYPHRPSAQRQLADLFDQEKWNEDECRTLETLDRTFPKTTDLQLEMANCWLDERRADRAIGLLSELAEREPGNTWVLARLHDSLRDDGRFTDAARTARGIISRYPEQLWPRLRLAETLRQSGDEEGADAVLAEAQQRFPYSAAVHRSRAALAWRKGDRQAAVEHWQAALARDPDDEATANRLDYVSPEATGPWAADVPDEDVLRQLVAARGSIQPQPGADLAYLLDHEVTQLRSDGSTMNIVTQVITALNQGGRDKLTRQRLQYAGRHRVMQAYSVDAKGRRSEASVRSREVLYRGLDVGSTIVIQYRADSPPSGFLPRYLTKTWFFQSAAEQRKWAQFVLWAPAGSALHEKVTGDLKREEKRVGDEIRVSWAVQDSPALVPEPRMPTIIESAVNLQLTTIPGWREYEKWEEALLEGAIRESAEVDQLAAKLSDGAQTVEEKLLRIHEFVMQEIRYEQDYESFIAGVKPHPASMVVERRYGDCKDKTVLFMTLAQKMGIKASFATVRTRDRGQVVKELPTQQFNHAIVYIPKQPGVEEGRFFDATADAMDLDSLRDDDAGTVALVYDPSARKHEWIPIPFQAPQYNLIRTELAWTLSQDGSAKGEMTLKGKGRSGSLLRRVPRNPEQFKQFLQMVAGMHFPGASTNTARPLQVTDLRQPAEVAVDFSAPNAARVEGESLRVRLPTEWSPKDLFNLADRKLPVLLGTPNEQQWKFDLTLPEGMQATRLPSSGEVATDCIVLKRTVTPTATGLHVEQSVTQKCERIPVEQYSAYRTQVEQMNRFLDEELVLTPAKKPIVKPVKATKAR